VLGGFVLQGFWYIMGPLPTETLSRNYTPFLHETEGVAGLVSTVGLVFVSYAGLTKVASISEEVRRPDRNLPLGMFLSLATASVVYVAGVAIMIAVLDPEHCAAIHLNMPIVTKPAHEVPLTDQDKADLASLQHFQREESGYALEQSTKPQTAGVALNDSPAGLLAWIVEKFRAWSDCDGHPEKVFTRDQLITNVMVYWVTGTITSSMRLYWEHRRANDAEPDHVHVPTGVARYPKEVLRAPRSWVELRYNVTHWADMPRGGHFAAMEQPDLFVEDLQTFFRTERRRS